MISKKFKMVDVSFKLKMFLALSTLFSVALADNVPVLMWSPSRPLSDLPQPFAGNTIDHGTFHQSYLSPLSATNDHHIVVFLQDKLNINDFAKYADIYNPYSDGGAFKNIKALMEEQFSVHIPSVKLPTTAISDLKESFKGRQHTVESSSDIPSLPLDDGKSHLILVILPSDGKAGNEEKAFRNNDVIVNDVVKELKKRSIKYTAVYTAESSQTKPAESKYTGRRLLASADATNTSIFVNVSSTIFFYARKITITQVLPNSERNMNFSITSAVAKPDTTGSMMGNTTGEFSLKFDDVPALNGTQKYGVAIKFAMTKNNAYRLKISNFTLTLTNKTVGGGDQDMDMDMDIKSLNLDFPLLFSYHCSGFNIIQTNRTKGEPYIQLYIDGLQFQVFGLPGQPRDQFGDAWDCVPFFTTAIWMALFYALIFIVILYFGIYMMFNLSTMDRFDDPKGKTITVNASD
ncbi:V-type proton ATPase subunit S1 [Patella vulgata]|uniref:V-type proton ATPase subunit S1 n=1 Tax=Patella vulgata TaxID=6465 RepID=UPI0024A9B394|nr:V-type proton ATPase subunit S1 [Patella vulgata]